MAWNTLRLDVRRHRYVLWGLLAVTAALGTWAAVELLAGRGVSSVEFQNAANLFVVAGIVAFIFRSYRPIPEAATPPEAESAAESPSASAFGERLVAHRGPSGTSAHALQAAGQGADPLVAHIASQADTPGRALRLDDLRGPRDPRAPDPADETFVTVHVEQRPDPVNTVKDAAGRDVEIVEYDEGSTAGPTNTPSSTEGVAGPPVPPRREDGTPPWSPPTPYIQ